jgi:hypothetical protein
MTSNLRIEEGTFETWIIPEWDGIDNNTDLQISILKNGYAINSNLVFIGASEYHPEYIPMDSFIFKQKYKCFRNTTKK